MRYRFTRPSEWSLRGHVAVASVFLVLCTSLVTGFSLMGSTRNSLDRRTEETLYRLSAQVGRRMENYVRLRGNMAFTISRIPGIESPERARAVVQALKDIDSGVAWAGITDATGKVIAGSDGTLNNVDISKRPVFIQGSKELHYGDVHEALLLSSLLPSDPQGRPTLFLDTSAPILGPGGKLLGVVAIHLDWNKARDLIVPMGRYEEGTEALIISSDGKVFVGPDSVLGKPLAMLKSVQRDGPHLEEWPDGQMYLSGSSLNTLFNWRVVLRQQRASINEFIYHAFSGTLILSILVSSMMSGVGWFAAGYIASPLRRLAQAADRMRRGESGGTLISDRSYSEISLLTESLGSMVSSLVKQSSQLQIAKGEADIARDEADRDELTGLPNRRVLMRVAAAITSGDAHMAVVCLDLDGFKTVNDTYGHPVGNDVLVMVTSRMTACLRPQDLLARVGGDEFVLLLMNEHAQEAKMVCNRIIHAVSQPMLIEGVSMGVGCSAGIAIWNKQSGLDWEEALQSADNALYDAKRAGKGRAMFASSVADDLPAP